MFTMTIKRVLLCRIAPDSAKAPLAKKKKGLLFTCEWGGFEAVRENSVVLLFYIVILPINNGKATQQRVDS